MGAQGCWKGLVCLSQPTCVCVFQTMASAAWLILLWCIPASQGIRHEIAQSAMGSNAIATTFLKSVLGEVKKTCTLNDKQIKSLMKKAKKLKISKLGVFGHSVDPSVNGSINLKSDGSLEYLTKASKLMLKCKRKDMDLPFW